MGKFKKPMFARRTSASTSHTVGPPRLYVEAPEGSWPLIYNPGYNISFAGLEKLHPFDAGKWGKVHQLLIDKKLVSKENFVEPLEANEEELLKVHTKRYLDSLRWSLTVAKISEIPPVALLPNFLVQRSVLRPFRLQTGGSILAGKLAMEQGWAINIGGGFHHCCADNGGGFCAYADITLNIKYLMENFHGVERVLIVDLDAHQGNGYARDFLQDESVYIMDIFNRYIYPRDQPAKRAIRRKVEVGHHIKDEEYLTLVKNHIGEAIHEFQPQYMVYNAGTDILIGDPLGGMDITPGGIIERDRIVFMAAKTNKIPIVMLTSGGYQRSTAQIIADSIANLHSLGLIKGQGSNVFQTEIN